MHVSPPTTSTTTIASCTHRAPQQRLRQEVEAHTAAGLDGQVRHSLQGGGRGRGAHLCVYVYVCVCVCVC